ncbi:hypothetical protein PG997_009580 [Apiospora hydei]|uniref:Altered inheritance of mitochondria protein 11 n=1 Tax=Apiospora hydei TaxID=1337664 RepID=A0ABR1VVQ8_9PEZI
MANDRDSKSESLPTATAPTAPAPTSTPTSTANATNIPETNASLQVASTRPDTRTPIFSQRSMKQLGLFFGGAVFLSLSTLITRRAVARKLRVTQPRFFIPSNKPANKLDGDNSLIAVEALGLATLNVFGFGIMATGGLSWAFDVSTVAELRGMARKTLGEDGSRTDEEAEREVEEWVAKVLFKKDGNDKGGQKPDKEVEKTK